MIKVIEDAFIEGRETDVDYQQSEAKKNQIRLDVALKNISLFSNKAKHSALPVDMICPNTGKILKQFSNRFEAAKYIVTDILQTPNRPPHSIYGNLTMCMRIGWKSYGYYWKLNESVATAPQIQKFKEPNNKTSKKQPRYVLYYGRQIKKLFKNITEAANYIGVSSKKLSQAFGNMPLRSLPTGKDGFTLERVNDVLIQIKVKDKQTLMQILGIKRRDTVNEFLRTGATRNNKTYIIQESGNGK